MSPETKLTTDQRRALVLRALRHESVEALAEEHGVSRQYVYKLINEAKGNPQGAIQEARKELQFRQRVRFLLD